MWILLILFSNSAGGVPVAIPQDSREACVANAQWLYEKARQDYGGAYSPVRTYYCIPQGKP